MCWRILRKEYQREEYKSCRIKQFNICGIVNTFKGGAMVGGVTCCIYGYVQFITNKSFKGWVFDITMVCKGFDVQCI